MISKVTDDRGYVSYLTSDGESVYQHQLVSLLDFEAKEVFDTERDIHHLAHFPSSAGVSLDLPGALAPVHSDVHREIHRNVPDCGPLSPSVETVLSRDN